MSTQDDTGLVERLRAGDKDAFDQLMRVHGSTVYRYGWAVADSPELVEDLVQDTFLTLWRKRRRVTLVGGSLLPWLLATCRFMAFNANRRERRTRKVDLDSVENVVTSSGDPASRDSLRWVADEVSRLSPNDQQLLEACIVLGKPYEDAARELGISTATARKRMQRVRERLRVARAEEGS